MGQDQAPNLALPPLTSSLLQVNSRATASGIAKRAAKTSREPQPAASPSPVREAMTLGALRAQIESELDEGQEFNPAGYLKAQAVSAPHRSGASLAGAALGRMTKR